MSRLPLPTLRAARLLAFGLLAMVLAVAEPAAAWLGLAFDVVVAALVLQEALGLRGRQVSARRRFDALPRAHVPWRYAIELSQPEGGTALGLTVRDALPEGWPQDLEGTSVALAPGETATLTREVADPPRGRVVFGSLQLRIEGPLGLAAIQQEVPAEEQLDVRPDLSEANGGAGSTLARVDPGLLRWRRRGEGREFDALRAFRPGDDLRWVDWKASARRNEWVAREYVPEKNQVVLLLVDCGRHLVAHDGGRPRLDHVLEAALRLARSCLAQGDAVGLCAFDEQVRAFVPPAKGAGHLARLVDSTGPLRARLVESDYGEALRTVQQRLGRRALVCLFTELADARAAEPIAARMLALRPRHLPLVVTLLDEQLEQVGVSVPEGVGEAFARQAARRLLEERAKVRRMLEANRAWVVAAPHGALSGAALQAYLELKGRGLL